MAGLCEHIKKTLSEESKGAFVEYMKRGDFERWIRESVGEEEIAKELRNLSVSMEKEDYTVNELKGRMCEIISEF